MNDNSKRLLNQCNASRKADREFIARALLEIAAKHGAKVVRRDEPRNPGYSGAGINLRITLNGVGAQLDIDNLDGGGTSMISWFNSERGAKNYISRFNTCVGANPSGRPHHKTTSLPADWYSLAMYLDAGLLLAARGEAFQADAT